MLVCSGRVWFYRGRSRVEPRMYVLVKRGKSGELGKSAMGKSVSVEGDEVSDGSHPTEHVS